MSKMLYILFITVSMLVLIMYFLVWYLNSSYKQSCLDAGGVPILSEKYSNHCINPSAIIEVK